MTKKLFAVKITYTAYAWVKDQFEAEDLVDEIIYTEECPEVLVTEVTSNILGWSPNCCVYHNDNGDITLGSVLDTSQKPSSEEP